MVYTQKLRKQEENKITLLREIRQALKITNVSITQDYQDIDHLRSCIARSERPSNAKAPMVGYIRGSSERQTENTKVAKNQQVALDETKRSIKDVKSQ